MSEFDDVKELLKIQSEHTEKSIERLSATVAGLPTQIANALSPHLASTSVAMGPPKSNNGIIGILVGLGGLISAFIVPLYFSIDVVAKSVQVLTTKTESLQSVDLQSVRERSAFIESLKEIETQFNAIDARLIIAEREQNEHHEREHESTRQHATHEARLGFLEQSNKPK